LSPHAAHGIAVLKSVLVRLILPMSLAAAAVSLIAMPFFDRSLADWFRGDVEMRAGLVFQSMQDRLAELLSKNDDKGARDYLTKFAADERLRNILLCFPDDDLRIRASADIPDLSCDSATLPSPGSSSVVKLADGRVLVSRFSLDVPPAQQVDVLVVHDLSFASSRQSRMRQFVLAYGFVAFVLLGLIVVAAAWWTLKRWSKLLIGDIRNRRFLDDATSPSLAAPVLSQVRRVLRDIEASQRLEIEFQENWTPRALQQVIRDHLQSPSMIVVSNREPYIHSADDTGKTQVQMPASGMVTALEPIMRACAGTWIAHGSGSRDRTVVDRHDRVVVPPEDPSYSLRRLWLSAEEELGYYYGFSNEGLWPLCHLAYVRPAFREADWQMFRRVNERFADAVLQESRSRNPVVLVQDFHLALLPRLVRQRLPDATIVLFWHIPWPSAETFGVCPWRRELLLHMLSADILGFHTRYHCQNFLAAVDRFIECQIDHEHMTVVVLGHKCHIYAYPISIEWPPHWLVRIGSVAACRASVRAQLSLPPEALLGVGVERWDFTKGILERFRALELFLDAHPDYQGRLSFLQVAAPSRSELPAYKHLQEQTLHEVERINARFGTSSWKPIVLIATHQGPEHIFELYRAADFCLVNSLHDGMNLVAKEFVAARDDEDGVLILSTFTGASRELVEALLVNPFDVADTAHAIGTALRMPRDERRQRMRLMRRTVKENSVFRWAGRMLMDASRIRQRQDLPDRTRVPAEN
jgi:trehalose 6-phosphate synthase/phosphatase